MWGMIPIIVQANFTDCHDLRMISQASDLVKPTILPICGGIWMYSYGRIYLLVPFSKMNHSLATRQIDGRNDDSADSLISRPFDHSITVCIKLPEIKMTMCVY
jgi:hypothetical protein